MSDARGRILKRLRRACGGPAPAPAPPAEPRHWPLSERLERLEAALRAVRTEVHRVTPETWPVRLSELAGAKGLRNLLYAPGTGPGRRLEAAVTGDPGLIPYRCPVEDWKERLFSEVDAAFTTTRGGIAETGSLILWPDALEPRLMSLVPPVHFALLEARHIHATFSEALESEGWSAGLPTNALLISGPSKSADIEQTLSYGVHGPKELVVLVVDSP